MQADQPLERLVMFGEARQKASGIVGLAGHLREAEFAIDQLDSQLRREGTQTAEIILRTRSFTPLPAFGEFIEKRLELQGEGGVSKLLNRQAEPRGVGRGGVRGAVLIPGFPKRGER